MVGNFEKFTDDLQQKYSLEKDIAYHLVNFYGTQADSIANESSLNGHERLHEDYPFLKHEVIHSMDKEMALKPNDVICRRIPLAFLDNKTADELLPEIVEIMAAH